MDCQSTHGISLFPLILNLAICALTLAPCTVWSEVICQVENVTLASFAVGPATVLPSSGMPVNATLVRGAVGLGLGFRR